MINDLILAVFLGRVPDWVLVLITSTVGVVALLVFAVFNALAGGLIERKLLGRFQIRYGPNRAGPVGLFQTLADALKILAKEAITPFDVDKWVYWAAPVVVLTPALLTFAVIPFAPGMVLLDINIGLLYLAAVGSLGVMPIFMAGWASNNKYSLLGAMRSVAMTVSYEIPLVLSLVGLILLGGSFHLGTLVDYQLQHGWFVFLQPLAFLLFLIAGTAEMSRTPMDLTEGESELVAGYHTEYSGFKFVMFYMAEYTHGFAISAMITTLFLGGWGTGPVLDLIPPAVWFVGKVYLMFCVFVWIRATLPRLRIDQLMGFAWKFLIPLALANIFIVALEVQAALPSLVVFAVNAVLAVILVMLWTQVVGRTGVAAQRTQYVTKLMSSS